jgi:hypothetical protein
MQHATENEKESRANTMTVYGHGINDLDEPARIYIGGKKRHCPFYQTWASMLKRAYSEKKKVSHPTYEGVTVTPEWWSRRAFTEWMRGQEWQGRHLDKDILWPGNKIYAPDKCLFVPPEINNLLTNCRSSPWRVPRRRLIPQRQRKKFEAYTSIKNKFTHIGYFTDVNKAECAFLRAKIGEIRRKAAQYPGPISTGLHRHIAVKEQRLKELEAILCQTPTLSLTSRQTISTPLSSTLSVLVS